MIDLNDCGLNKYETEAYLALVREGVSTAHLVSKTSTVPYGKIYPVLASLEQKGFVKTFEGLPKRFIAVEPKIILEEVTRKRKKELKKFESDTQKLIQTLGALSARKPNETYETIRIIEGYENYLNLSIELHNQAKQDWLSITGLEIHKKHYDATRDCIKRGVKVKLLTFIDEQKKKNAALWKKIGCEVRYAEFTPTHFSIIDGKEVTIRITGEERYLALWLKNKSLAQNMKVAFNELWAKAKK